MIMWCFVKKIILFLIPIGLIFAFPILIYILGREYYSLNKIITEQIKDSKILYGPAYGSLDQQYKEQVLTKISPVITVIGSSKSLEFKKEFFSESNNFFVIGNGGNMQSVESLNRLIKKQPPKDSIKYVILTLDSAEFVARTPIVKTEKQLNKFVSFMIGGWKTVYVDYFIRHKFSVKALIAKSKISHNIGLLAMINQDGYRIDGSYQYTKIKEDVNYKSSREDSIKKELESIRNNGNISEYGEELSTAKINVLSDTLKLCREKNIQVVGISIPRPTAIYQELNSQEYLYRDMVKNLPIELDKTFSANGFNYYDLSDLKLLGASDSEFLDWIHPTDKMYLRMTIYIAEKNQQFRQYVDINKLKEMLKNTKGDFLDI